MTLRRAVGLSLLFILVLGLLSAAWLAVMPITSTKAAGPLDRACMAHLRKTTDLTRTQRVNHCRVKARFVRGFRIAEDDPTSMLGWNNGNMGFIDVRARFEIAKQHTPYPWSSRKWTVTDKHCWVAGAFLYTVDIQDCSWGRSNGVLTVQMSYRASVAIFDWAGGLLTRGIRNWVTIDDATDTRSGIHQEG